MFSGSTFQREGATYLKARWPYRFVLESLGPGTSRRDLDADLRRREGLCFWRRSERWGGGGGGYHELTGKWHREVCGGSVSG